MSTAFHEEFTLPDGVKRDLKSLSTRAAQLTKQGTLSGTIAGLGAASTLILLALGHYLGPSLALSTPDIPDALARMVASASETIPVMDVQIEAVGALLRGPMPTILAVATVMMGCALGFLNQSTETAIKWIVHGLVIFVVSWMGPGLFGGSSQSGAGSQSLVADFIRRGESEQLAAMLAKLDCPLPQQAYVLAQAQIRNAQEKRVVLTGSNLDELRSRVRLVTGSLASPGLRNVSGEVLYSLEMESFGAALSAPAREYSGRSTYRANIARTVGWMIAAGTTAVGLYAATLCSLGGVLRRRHTRLHALIAAARRAPQEVELGEAGGGER